MQRRKSGRTSRASADQLEEREGGGGISSPPSLCMTASSFICTYTQYKSHIANFLKKILQRILAGIKETVVKVKKKERKDVHKSGKVAQSIV